MKPEQRLLLALTITLGILVFWTTLFPPPQAPQTPPTQPATVAPAIQKIESDETIDLSMGYVKFGVEKSKGGIQDLKVDGSKLLVGAVPGFLQVKFLGSTEPPTFETWVDADRLTSVAKTAAGLTITRIISPSGDSHKLLSNLELKVSNSSQETKSFQLSLVTYQPLSPEKQTETQYLKGIVSVGGKKHPLQVKPGQSRRFEGSPAWITAESKSHVVVLKPTEPAGLFHVEHFENGPTVGWLELPPTSLPPGGEARWDFKLYTGPMILPYLKQAGLEEAISIAGFLGISKLLLNTIAICQRWFHNYGLVIIFLSFLIWLIFFPLTWSGIRMMKVMGDLKPQMERIQREHKKNPQKMNQEMLQLYKKHKVNPLSGCLPLLLQMPIFISLYEVLTRSAQLRGANFLWIRDLASPDALIRFEKPVPLLGESFNILPLFMAVAMFIQQKLSQTKSVALTEEQILQQKMFKWFPLLFGFLFYSMPSGLVLYWVTNTILTLGQYLLASRLHST